MASLTHASAKIITAAMALFLLATTAGQAEDALGTVRDGVTYLNVDEAAALLAETEDLLVLDVRTDREFTERRLPDAVQANFLSPRFRKRIQALDRDRPMLVYCRTGRRSSRAVRVLMDEGFTQIYHLDGGITAWTAAEETLVAGRALDGDEASD